MSTSSSRIETIAIIVGGSELGAALPATPTTQIAAPDPGVPVSALTPDEPTYLPFQSQIGTTEGIAIGIDLGAATLRVAVWDPEQRRAVPISTPLPCVAAYVNATRVLVGGAALHTNVSDHVLIGLQRLLGRSYASLGGAKWLGKEADGFIGAALVPEDGADAGGRVRLREAEFRAALSNDKYKAIVPGAAGGITEDQLLEATVKKTSRLCVIL